MVALLHCGGLHLRLDIYVRFGRPLGSGQLGRGTLAGRGTACVRALLVHGSFAVQRLQVRMTTVEPMSVCVQVLDGSHECLRTPYTTNPLASDPARIRA